MKINMKKTLKVSSMIVVSLLMISITAMAVNPPAFLRKFGSPGTGDGQFGNPRRVALSGALMYVADAAGNRIHKFDFQGNFITKWGSYGTANGQFRNPNGVAVDSAGNVYVADTGNYRIQKFDANGTYISQFGNSSILPYPYDVDVDSSGNIYVADFILKVVKIFDQNFNYLRSLKHPQNWMGGPIAVSVDPNGYVAVADQTTARIYRFAPNGSFLNTWSTPGPYGIDTDASGNIYVASFNINNISCFNQNGTLIYSFGSYGTGNGQFKNPWGVAVKPSGATVVVADTSNYRIQEFGEDVLLNQPPVADAGPDKTTHRDQLVVLDGSASYDPDNDTLSYAWDFGDGQTGSDAVVTHAYSTLGNKTVTLTVSDGKGGTATDSCIVTVNNYPPVANAGPDKVTNRNSDVPFNGGASTDPDGTIVTYTWDFGDNTPDGSGAEVTHKYTSLGTYVVTLTVKDNDNGTATDTAVVTVENKLPVAVAGPAQEAHRNVDVELNGGNSYDPDGTIASYSWNFGDGTTGTGKIATHKYTTLGEFTVTLTVTDNNGGKATDTTTVTIVNKLPSANAGPDQESYRNIDVIFNGQGSDNTDGTIISYKWDFGDGQSYTGTTPTAIHQYTNIGTYNAVLTVTDNDGGQASDTAVVTIKNAAPVANAGVDQTISAITAAFTSTAVLDASGSTDFDGNIASYSWNFGDGTTGSGQTVTHQYTAMGTYTVTLTVTDNDGATATDTCIVTMNGKFIECGTSGQIKIPMPSASGELPPGLDTAEKTIYLTAEQFALYHPVSQGKSPKTGKGFQVYTK